MSTLRVLTASEQVAGHLRQELISGTWTGTMPGESRLISQLGVGRDTLKSALSILEHETSSAMVCDARLKIDNAITPTMFPLTAFIAIFFLFSDLVW